MDDVYISLAYAHEWVETGALQWTTGERVEGYSNFLHVALLALGVADGADGAVFAQLVALAGGIGLLGVVGAYLPPTRAGTVVLLSLAAWSALAWWSTVGMETTTFALLFAAGWALVLGNPRSYGVGVALLALGALERPEGSVWLLAALAARARFPRKATRADAMAAVAVAGVLAWHVWRVAWFGSFLPTPLLVKIATVGGSWGGLAQAAGDVLVAGGWLVGVAVVARVSRRDLPWVLAPVVGQALVLARAEGDWMGMSRLMLPGLVASATAWLALGRPRTVGVSATAALAGAGLVGALFTPGGERRLLPSVRALPTIAPWHAFTRGLDTPVDADVAFVVTNVPAGQRALVVDAGMLGNVPALQLLDMHGLTWRACAEALASGRHVAFLLQTLRGPNPPEFVRFAYWGGVAPGEDLESWLPTTYRLRIELPYAPDSFVRWYATHDERPDRATVDLRWRTLAERYPSQPFLDRSYERLVATGDDSAPVGAPQGASQGGTRSNRSVGVPHAEGLDAARLAADLFVTAAEHPWHPGRGAALYWNATLEGRGMTRAEAMSGALHLDADAPGSAGAEARVAWTGACGARAEIVTVRGPTDVPSRLPCDGDGPFALQVSFLNDASTPEDRNLYVAWARSHVP